MGEFVNDQRLLCLCHDERERLFLVSISHDKIKMARACHASPLKTTGPSWDNAILHC